MFNDIKNEQVRQLIDAEHVYQAYRNAHREMLTRFAGSMAWKRVGSHDYLYRQIRGKWKSLGGRNPSTEETFRAFTAGQAQLKESLAGLSRRLDEMAPVNRALRLGRVPRIVSRINRRIEEVGPLGNNLIVIGTNALFAYERLAGVHLESGYLATGDVDLLFDARSRLKFASDHLKPNNVLRLLQGVDRSFHLIQGFSAENKDGFLVDLIRPQSKYPILRKGSARIADLEGGSPSKMDSDDLEAVEIFGLIWLVNSPKVDVVVMGEDGYPLRLICPDPRAFVLHKLWLSERIDRDPPKKIRDRGQAQVIHDLLQQRLPNMPFDDRDLSAMPARIRNLMKVPDQVSNIKTDLPKPNW